MSQQKHGMFFQNILNFVFRLKWWILAGAVAAFLAAFLYVKSQTPVFVSKITVEVRNDDADSPDFSFSSPALMAGVIEDLGLNYSYSGSRRKEEFYKDSPFALEIFFDELDAASSRPESVSLEFIPVSDGSYRIVELMVGRNLMAQSDSLHVFGEVVDLGGVSLVLNTDGMSQVPVGRPFKASFISEERLTGNLAARLKTGKDSSGILTMSMEDSDPDRASDILNCLVSEYNRQEREYRTQNIISSLEFLDERILDLSRELDQKQYGRTPQAYSRRNETGSSAAFSQLESELAGVRMQSAFLGIIKDELSKMGSDDFHVLPSGIGISDRRLVKLVGDYNAIVLDRNVLLADSDEADPAILDCEARASRSKKEIAASVLKLERIYQVKEKELDAKYESLLEQSVRNSARKVDAAGLPSRQIAEPLFLELSRRREELSLSLCSMTDKATVISPATPSDRPVSPDATRICILAVILGCLLPVMVVLFRKAFRTKVETKEDVEKYLGRPVLAVLPKSKDVDLVSDFSSRSIKAEAFRMLRTTLQQMPGKVIQVTSSVPGEGKSFVSANLAISLAFLGKKVCLLGLDLRNPTLNTIITGVDAEDGHTVSEYLSDANMEPSSIISKYYNEGWTTDIMFPGPVPAHPSELLSGDRMVALVDWCKENYDYVIMDSTPFFAVPDSSIVNRYADITLYVVRSDVSQLRMLQDISDAIDNSALRNVSIILNSVNMDSAKYRYGYGNGYGHGYGYGYGYGTAPAYASGKSSLKELFTKISGRMVSVVKFPVDKVKDILETIKYRRSFRSRFKGF